jgi:hypothetical protein
MPSIPVDVLHLILEHVDKASLAKICLLNKVCCPCSQDILYRDIQINGHRFSNSAKLCKTLSESTHLAKRVLSFEVIDFRFTQRFQIEQELRKSLQNMTRLRSLSFDNASYFSTLKGCTFKLDSFSSNGYHPEKALHQFLCSQPGLTDVRMGTFFSMSDVPEWGPCLPNLTRVTTHFSRLPYIIPNRPVNQVISYGYNKSVDLSFFTLSTAPIQKLEIDYICLYSAPLQPLASIFPSLTHLTLRPHTENPGMVSKPFFIYLSIIK